MPPVAATQALLPLDPLPLEGLTVVELPAIGPVPFAGMVLRQLGAEVTRILPPQSAELGVPLPAALDLLVRDKRVRTLDLKQPADRDGFLADLAQVDVLLEGFRPGVLERLGLAPEVLARCAPRLVLGRIGGWGTHGPLAQRAGHDINFLALSGLLHATGPEDHPLPPLNVVGDFGGGAMYALVGVLARLVQRGITGRGGVASTSILGGASGLTAMFHGLMAGGLWHDRRHANLLDGAAPFYRCYRCEDGGFVAVGALEPRFYRQMLDLVGLADDPVMQSQMDRSRWPAMIERLTAAFARRTRDAWAEAAAPLDACVSPVLSLLEAGQHPQNRLNRHFIASTALPAGIEPALPLQFTDAA